MKLELGGAAPAHREALDRLERDRGVARIWDGDATLWKREPAHLRTIENALGWLTVADRMEAERASLETFAEEARAGTDRVVVLGMGGSSLAPLVFASSLGGAKGYPPVEVLDSTEPSSVLEAERRGDPARTLYVVSSKSGTTLEPNILFDYFYDAVQRALGSGAGDRFVVVTDPGSALEKEAARRRVRRVFAGDPKIGGRYSALSPFGLVPAALQGSDLARMLAGARRMAERCRAPAAENPGAVLGAAMAALAREGRDKLTFSVGESVDRFGMWAEQLIAESTGKEGKGILPVEGEPLGEPEDYGSDRFFVRIETRGREDAEAARRLSRLSAAGHPAAAILLEDSLDLGAEMFRWEFATAVAGVVLGINPFDQPNVQEAKDRTNEILGGESAARGRPAVLEEAVAGGALRKLLRSLRPGDYFAITAYVPSTEQNAARLDRLRGPVRAAKKVATTVGFGPRFLHSTGQLHKGGPDTGVFLQITAEPEAKVPVPGKPYGFADVVAAQAAGDLAALKSRGRRALSVCLNRPLLEALDRLEEAVRRALA